MKTLNHRLAEFTCTCGNHHVLSPGSTCDICMGTVYATVSPDDEYPVEKYDEVYFEELDALYESEMIWAA